jgi:hypothetical protein
MNCTNSFASFFSTYKDALLTISWFIAMYGWYVTNRQANSREKRKETRSEIDSISKSIYEVYTKLRSYYRSDNSDGKNIISSDEIAFEVKRILVRCERLKDRLKPFQGALTACEGFFESVTKEPFASHEALDPDLSRSVLREAEESAHNLVDKLEEGFDVAFSGGKK